MSAELTEDQIRADVMYRLLRKNCWGAKYLPVDTLVNWIGKQVKRDGKRVTRIIDDLHKEAYLLMLKRGETVSLNPARSKEITQFVERNIRWVRRVRRRAEYGSLIAQKIQGPAGFIWKIRGLVGLNAIVIPLYLLHKIIFIKRDGRLLFSIAASSGIGRHEAERRASRTWIVVRQKRGAHRASASASGRWLPESSDTFYIHRIP